MGYVPFIGSGWQYELVPRGDLHTGEEGLWQARGCPGIESQTRAPEIPGLASRGQQSSSGDDGSCPSTLIPPPPTTTTRMLGW